MSGHWQAIGQELAGSWLEHFGSSPGDSQLPASQLGLVHRVVTRFQGWQDKKLQGLLGHRLGTCMFS
jgi:hypothetical protein